MSNQPSSDLICYACRQILPEHKSSYECGICQNPICKKCVCAIDKDHFSFMGSIPADLAHTTYCSVCYYQQVAPAMQSYADTMKRAEGLYVFEKSTRNLPLLVRSKHKVSVLNCPDRKETLLRLAFLAAEQSFNAIAGVELECQKVRINHYQTSVWSGSGYPATYKDRGQSNF